MGSKIKLTEKDLTSMIEKLVKEHRVGGYGYGFVQEDSEAEETFNYGEDEGADHKKEMGLRIELVQSKNIQMLLKKICLMTEVTKIEEKKVLTLWNLEEEDLQWEEELIEETNNYK